MDVISKKMPARTTPSPNTAAASDFDGDGRTDSVEIFLFADAYRGTDAKIDLDGNGTAEFADVFIFVDVNALRSEARR